jgi:hypothetical protein
VNEVGKIFGPKVELLNKIDANMLDKFRPPDTLAAAFLLEPAVKSKSNTKNDEGDDERMNGLSLLWFEIKGEDGSEFLIFDLSCCVLVS